MTNPSKHFLIMAGGTGGHVFPGLAVAKQLQSMGHTVSWLGTRNGIEADVVPKAGINIDYIKIQGVRGKGWAGLLLAPFKIAMAVAQSLQVLGRVRPAVVLGMGGFAAGPGAVAAKLRGIPLLIHEQNAIAGTTNRILSHMASRVLAAFPNAFPVQVNAEVVGNPVRTGLQPVDRNIDNGQPLHLLVLGGSLGARAINEVIPHLIKALGFSVELWHQTGKSHAEQVKALYGQDVAKVRVVPFIDDMAEAYGWADMVICRSGAMTVSELAVAGLPAIFIPFPFAIDDHQTANAQWMVNAGAAILLPQTEMSVGRLQEIVTDLHQNREKLIVMKHKAAAMGIHDATCRVADYCVELAR